MKRHRNVSWLEVGVVCFIIGVVCWWLASKGVSPISAIRPMFIPTIIA